MTAFIARATTEAANLEQTRKALRNTEKLVKKSILPNIKRAAKRGYSSYMTGMIQGRTNGKDITAILEERGYTVINEDNGISKICW